MAPRKQDSPGAGAPVGERLKAERIQEPLKAERIQEPVRVQRRRRAQKIFEGLGPALQALRTEAGFSRSDVSKTSGLSGAALSRYESGKALPNLEALDEILSALGLDALDLALELYRQQAQETARARPLFERKDLLASPMGRQVLDHARTLFFMGNFWIDAALALLPAFRAAGPGGEGSGEPAEPVDGEARRAR